MEISMEDVLENKCPTCSAAPTAKCLDKKYGGIGGMNWIENPHVERIKLAIFKKNKPKQIKQIEAA